ncbi:hypothetical protein [Peribacillus simplex]|uniref:hypothetical protein n=1 Tax=Peribacillus simplex TaxID=1478 RepID=UPI003D2E5E67
MNKMFLIQLGAFLVLLLIVGLAIKLVGSYGIYAILSILGLVLIFMLVNSDFSSKTFWFILLFIIASAVGAMRKHFVN